MSIDSWDEIRTAWHVAQAGTVSGAAEALGVHHATVIRHIDALEARLGVRLFQRHARGYTPTEAGAALAQVAHVTGEQFAQLATRLGGTGDAMAGDLIITTLPELAPLLRPAVAQLAGDYPDLSIRVLTERRLARLEYGEAHLALRAGPQPTEPDNVARHLADLTPALYASAAYVARRGMPTSDADLSVHRFVASDDADSRAPFARWLEALRPAPRIVLRSNEAAVRRGALLDGLGIGFLTPSEAGDGLVTVMPPRADWTSQIWLVTHVDLHRTAKVQAASRIIRESLRA